MTKKKKEDRIAGKLFRTRVGMCSISMLLDVRHPDGGAEYPLCICFSINRKRIYHSLGEHYSHEELTKMMSATGQGEHRGLVETNFERKQRLSNTFSTYVTMVEELHQTGILTLERIKTMLTGRNKSNSFVEEWENTIEEIVHDGKAGTADSYKSAYRCFVSLSGFTRFEGFAISKEIIDRWIAAMKDKGISVTTQAIYLRSCRVIVNRCIEKGFIMQRNYMFGRGKTSFILPRQTIATNNTLATTML